MSAALPAAPAEMTARDVEQLRMLVIGHYVVAGIQALMGCFPVIHLVIGVSLVTGHFGAPKPGETDPRWMGWFFVAIALTIMTVSWGLAAALIVAARKLARREGYVACLVIAAFAAFLNMPLGTALGACTLIVLLRPQVKAAFEANG